MSLGYAIFIRFYGWMMLLAALFNKRARIWVNVRKDFPKDLKQKAGDLSYDYWVHCASAGEFEQAIPILWQLRSKYTERKIAVSFFSSSGYDLYIDSGLADLFFYFPLDTLQNARQIAELLRPHAAIFIRNEIWWNTLSVLKEKNIPAYLVNANRTQERNFFYRFYLDRAYPLFTQVMDTATFGNTKLDRVCAIQKENFSDEVLKDFCRPNDIVIMLGSSWSEEEKGIVAFYKKYKSKFPNLKIVIAPHEFNSSKKQELENLFDEKINAYSSYQPGNNLKILFLDKKGILKYAYRYSTVAVIGGGFEKTVHNVTEAAIYGIPMLFGPNYKKFEEITELVDLKAAFPVNDREAFENILNDLIVNESLRDQVKEKLHNYFSTRQNASEKIVSIIAQ